MVGEEARDTVKVIDVVQQAFLNEVVIDCLTDGVTGSATRAHNCKLCSVWELTEQLDCKSMEIKWYIYMK